MKLPLAAVGAALALVWLSPGDAVARGKGYGSARYKSPSRNYRTYYGRPASIGSNGLCQRDTGTPTSQLNFRNRCDTEEFWNRTMQGGRRR